MTQTSANSALRFHLVKILILLFSAFSLQLSTFSAVVPALSALPDKLPQNYKLRDWRQTAHNLDALVFNTELQGDYLPLLWWETSKININRIGFAIPAYVGDLRQTPQRKTDYDGITVLGSVLGASLVGIDKSKQNGRDYVSMLSTLFRSGDGTNLYLNGVKSSTGSSYWYELLPSLLFYQIHSLYPQNAEHRAQFIAIAERWHGGTLSLTNNNLNNTPDFDHTAFNFATGKSFDNPRWREPDAAAGVAFIEYIAHIVTGDERYRQAAAAALRFLDERRQNPLYEILLPYGAYTAARANAEQGAVHDTGKLLNWCFDGSNRRKWGMLSGTWEKTPVDGLIGATNANHEYAFAMNTFLTAALIAPIARYDDRFSGDIAKWILHAAANARYYYPDAWPASRQTSLAWSKKYDPKTSIAYEGVRKNARHRARPIEEKTHGGTVTKPKNITDRTRFSLSIKPDKDQILQLWRFEVPKGNEHTIAVILDPDKHPKAPCALEILTAPSPRGPWTSRYAGKPNGTNRLWFNTDIDGTVYVLLRNTAGNSKKGKPAQAAADKLPTLHIKETYIDTRLPFSPYASGDPLFLGWGRTDLGLYGSVFSGVFGALITPTDTEGILLINLTATEVFPAKTYPTHILRNPHNTAKTVTIPLTRQVAAPIKLYDAITNKILHQNLTGNTVRLTLQPKQTLQLVQLPANGTLSQKNGKVFCDGIVIDHQAMD